MCLTLPVGWDQEIFNRKHCCRQEVIEVPAEACGSWMVYKWEGAVMVEDPVGLGSCGT